MGYTLRYFLRCSVGEASSHGALHTHTRDLPRPFQKQEIFYLYRTTHRPHPLSPVPGYPSRTREWSFTFPSNGVPAITRATAVLLAGKDVSSAQAFRARLYNPAASKPHSAHCNGHRRQHARCAQTDEMQLHVQRSLCGRAGIHIPLRSSCIELYRWGRGGLSCGCQSFSN